MVTNKDIHEMQPDEKVRAGVALVFEGLSAIIKNLASVFNKILIDSGVNIVDWNEFIKTYPNRKVVHLAFHASKDRTRKKNMARLRNDYYRKN